MKKLIGCTLALVSIMFFNGCSSDSGIKLGDIKYNLEKDQTYIIDDWYRQEGASMAKLGFWGRIITEGGKIKFQPVESLADSFAIDRYPLRVGDYNHEEFKSLIVNVKGISSTYGDLEKVRSEEYDLIALSPSKLLFLENKLNELYLQNDETLNFRITSENFRFVSKVLVVLEHDKAEALLSDYSGDVTLSLGSSISKVIYRDDSSQEQSINIHNGQIIAYQLSRICWNDENIIETVEDRGLDINNCSPFDNKSPNSSR